MPSPPQGSAPPDRVLVVGVGFLGSHVLDALDAAGVPARALTRSTPRRDTADIVVGDACDPRALARSLEGVGHVVYAAGGLMPAAAERDPALDARLTLAPLDAVLAALARRPWIGLTHLSSGGLVYGEPEVIPTPEDHPARPRGVYGRLRLVCEVAVHRARLRHGLRARVLRCSTVYGEWQPPDRGQGAVVTFLRRVADGEPIAVFGPGDHERDFVYAGDVARAVVALMDRPDAPSTLNVGSGEGTSLAELVALVEAQVGRRARIARLPARAFDVRRSVLDISRLHAAVEYEPVPLAEGIARLHRTQVAASAGARLAGT